MRSSPGDLLSLRSMFIDSSTKLYASGCKCRDGSYSGLNARSYSCCECFQTAIIVTEVNGDDCFRTPSTLCRIVQRMTITLKECALHQDVLRLCLVTDGMRRLKSWRCK